MAPGPKPGHFRHRMDHGPVSDFEGETEELLVAHIEAAIQVDDKHSSHEQHEAAIEKIYQLQPLSVELVAAMES